MNEYGLLLAIAIIPLTLVIVRMLAKEPEKEGVKDV